MAISRENTYPEFHTSRECAGDEFDLDIEKGWNECAGDEFDLDKKGRNILSLTINFNFGHFVICNALCGSYFLFFDEIVTFLKWY